MKVPFFFFAALMLFVLSCSNQVTKKFVDGDSLASADSDTTANSDNDTITGDGKQNDLAQSDSDNPKNDNTTSDGITNDTTVNDGTINDNVTNDTTVNDNSPDIKPDIDTVKPDCSAGDTRSIACGLNKRGSQAQDCSGGHWVDNGSCVDTDVCTDDAVTSSACGLNNRGTQTNTCVTGQWQAGMCTDTDLCTDSAEQTITCGTKGEQKQTCVTGQWSNTGGCNEPGRWKCQSKVCTPVYADAICGNGKCEPKLGESKKSCPQDCTFTGTDKTCTDSYDCAFLDWTNTTTHGYWSCEGYPKKCKTNVTNTYCGTTGNDYCAFSTSYIESDVTCPADCAKDAASCNNDYECIYNNWPAH